MIEDDTPDLSDLKAAPRRPRKLRESDIETHFVRTVRTAGGEAPKFVSPARRSVPDRIVLMPIPPAHRAIVARYFRFVELKAPGEKASPAQEREHARLRALGFAVDVIDAKDASLNLIASLKK